MITVNGKCIEWVPDETVSELISRMRYTHPLIFVKLNGRLVRTDRYESTRLTDRDDVQIIHLMTGG